MLLPNETCTLEPPVRDGTDFGRSEPSAFDKVLSALTPSLVSAADSLFAAETFELASLAAGLDSSAPISQSLSIKSDFLSPEILTPCVLASSFNAATDNASSFSLIRLSLFCS